MPLFFGCPNWSLIARSGIRPSKKKNHVSRPDFYKESGRSGFNHLCRAVVLKISHACCKQPNACSNCFKQYFPFLLGGENIHNYCIKSIASSHYFIKSIGSSRCALKILREILPFTRLFMILLTAHWASQKLRPKSKTILCYTSDCFKSFTVRRYIVLI